MSGVTSTAGGSALPGDVGQLLWPILTNGGRYETKFSTVRLAAVSAASIISPKFRVTPKIVILGLNDRPAKLQ